METKQRIIDALLTLSQTTTFDKIRVSQICTQLGIQRKLFYYYFPDKYALLAHIYQQDLDATFSPAHTTRTNWSQRAQQLLTTYQQRQRFYRHTIDADDGLWHQCFQQHMSQLFLQLFSELGVREQTDLTFYAHFYASGWTTTIAEWIQQRFDQAIPALVVQFDTLITFTKDGLAHWPKEQK